MSGVYPTLCDLIYGAVGFSKRIPGVWVLQVEEPTVGEWMLCSARGSSPRARGRDRPGLGLRSFKGGSQ